MLPEITLLHPFIFLISNQMFCYCHKLMLPQFYFDLYVFVFNSLTKDSL